jgi:hypothetical protein
VLREGVREERERVLIKYKEQYFNVKGKSNGKLLACCGIFFEREVKNSFVSYI